MAFKNFSMWRGRLPHWRADDVRYYVTFRHRRPLDDWERRQLFSTLSTRKLDILILCILPETTELIFSVKPGVELAKIVEPAKRKAGDRIIKRSGERYPPFYTESYDRIIRDDVELEERWQAIFDSPITHELVESNEDWDGLWVSAQ